MAKDNAIYSNNLNDKMQKKGYKCKKIKFWGKTLNKMGHKKITNIFIISCLTFFPHLGIQLNMMFSSHKAQCHPFIFHRSFRALITCCK
jgi:hypothetical protein